MELHQSYLSHEDFVIILTNLRGMYDQILKPGQPLDYRLLSEAGTLLSTLNEVCI